MGTSLARRTVRCRTLSHSSYCTEHGGKGGGGHEGSGMPRIFAIGFSMVRCTARRGSCLVVAGVFTSVVQLCRLLLDLPGQCKDLPIAFVMIVCCCADCTELA